MRTDRPKVAQNDLSQGQFTDLEAATIAIPAAFSDSELASMTADEHTRPTPSELEEENRRLKKALTDARESADTTARLVSAQFVKIERTMALLEEKIELEGELRDSLSEELVAAEIHQHELNEARQHADAANRAKSSFLASMSHELRTPLNAIIGYAEFLVEERGDIDEEESADVISKIASAGRHLLGLINDILDLSKIEAGKVELFVERIEVAAILSEVIATLRPLAENQQNRLTIEVDAELGTMHSDSTKLRQILLNLLSNACKFTESGEIILRAQRQEKDNTASIIIEVEDSGIGITEDQLARLFQPFVQADVTTSSRYGGTGLGLAITKRLCQLMGGSISATSTLGRGSIFKVELPCVVPSDPANPPLPAAPN